MIDAVTVFADEARRFREWVLSGTESGQAAAREALVRITRLYLAALTLPQPWCEEMNSASSAVAVAPSRWKEIYAALATRLPFQHYGEVFNPLPVPPEESIIADLADDIADIFGDVNSGLQHYEAGRRAEAVWDWGFGLTHHWGEHATSAIRAIHCYLAAE